MIHRTLIDAETLAAGLQRPDWRVFDCRFDLADSERGEREYHRGHIPGAHYAHQDRDLAAPVSARSGRHPLPDPHVLGQWLGRAGVRDGVQAVVYDDSGGNMAVRLWWLLRWLGHDAVALLDGGWQAWRAAGGGQDSTLPGVDEQNRFHPRRDDSMFLTTTQVEENLHGGDWLLLDARTAERYRGEQEPIDPVAGHIPGSLSRPLQDNLAADGRFLPPERLRAEFLALLAGHPPQRAACLCGSGVSACHNLLAMELAGLGGVRLYAGSWSEWIRDPERPVAVGAEP